MVRSLTSSLVLACLFAGATADFSADQGLALSSSFVVIGASTATAYGSTGRTPQTNAADTADWAGCKKACKVVVDAAKTVNHVCGYSGAVFAGVVTWSCDVYPTATLLTGTDYKYYWPLVEMAETDEDAVFTYAVAYEKGVEMADPRVYCAKKADVACAAGPTDVEIAAKVKAELPGCAKADGANARFAAVLLASASALVAMA